MYVTRSVEVFIKTRQVITMPVNAQILAVRRIPAQGPSIFLDLLFNEPDDGRPLTEKRIIYIAQLGAELPEYDEDKFDYIGDVTYNKELTFHVYDCGLEE